VLAPSDRGPELGAAIDASQATFAGLGATPFADRLEAVLARPAERGGQRLAAVTTPTETATPASAT